MRAISAASMQYDALDFDPLRHAAKRMAKFVKVDRDDQKDQQKGGRADVTVKNADEPEQHRS